MKFEFNVLEPIDAFLAHALARSTCGRLVSYAGRRRRGRKRKYYVGGLGKNFDHWSRFSTQANNLPEAIETLEKRLNKMDLKEPTQRNV